MKTLFNTSNIIKKTLLATMAVVTLIISLTMSTLETLACTNEEANQSNMQALAGANNSYGYEYEGGGTDAVSRGQRWVGRAKYVWGACEPGAFDEAGFVSYCVTGCYHRIDPVYEDMYFVRSPY